MMMGVDYTGTGYRLQTEYAFTQGRVFSTTPRRTADDSQIRYSGQIENLPAEPALLGRRALEDATGDAYSLSTVDPGGGCAWPTRSRISRLHRLRSVWGLLRCVRRLRVLTPMPATGKAAQAAIAQRLLARQQALWQVEDRTRAWRMSRTDARR